MCCHLVNKKIAKSACVNKMPMAKQALTLAGGMKVVLMLFCKINAACGGNDFGFI